MVNDTPHGTNHPIKNTDTRQDVPSTLLPHPFPHTFTQIIDADHFTIERLAAKIRRLSPSTPSFLPQLKPLLLEATWRLIRHDFSEEMVMRPAFIEFLGQEGMEMVERDRADHEGGRRALVRLIGELENLERSLGGSSKGSTVVGKEEYQEGVKWTLKVVAREFDDLKKHMDIESGKFLPCFERHVERHAARGTSESLAREYAMTLVMTPDVMVANGDTGEDTERVPFFVDGVAEYIACPLERMRELYGTLLDNARFGRDGGEWVRKEVQKRIEELRIGKWVTLNERDGWKQEDVTRSWKEGLKL